MANHFPIELIVGLGNPGAQYEATRHNAGFWFVEQLARRYGASLQPEAKFFGHTTRINISGRDVRLLNPMTFMNRSGQAVAALSTFFKIPVHNMLIVHDELDLPPGIVRLKTGGGHGGHNGLKDIIARHGNSKDFHRLRLGIGHPGSAPLVANYVLTKPSVSDLQKIEAAIDVAVDNAADIVSGDFSKAMQVLHTFVG